MIIELKSPLFKGQADSCAHCGSELPKNAQTTFCCSGCEAVHALLSDHGLKDFYSLKQRFGGSPSRQRQRSPVASNTLTETLLEDPRLVQKAARDASGNTLVFALEGIQCAACLWLLERLPQAHSAVQAVRVDLGRGEIWVTRTPGASFVEIVRFLSALGYPAHVVSVDGSREGRFTAENRALLLRLGVAASAAGNVMLYAVSVYAGASGALAMYFAWFSFALSLPVVTYSAWPLWKSVFSNLRLGALTLDTPVMLAVAVSFIWSSARLLQGNPHVFFDSISALVFLLLASRYILRRMQQKSALLGDVSPFLLPVWCIRMKSTVDERVLTSALRPGDRVRVGTGERFPADGVLEQETLVASAFLTGESMPRLVPAEEEVFAGSENFGQPVVFRVRHAGADTRLQKILSRAEVQAPSDLTQGTFQAWAGKTWTLAALTLATGLAVGAGWTLGWEVGASRALALLVVTCPCGFAFAAPLGQAFALARARERGIYAKNGAVISRGAEIETVLLDKTGTLTEGELECVESWVEESDQATIRRMVYRMERSSRHPVARALVRWVGDLKGVTEIGPTEPLPTGGIRMTDAGVIWEITPAQVVSSDGLIRVELRKDGARAATWTLRDRTRDDSRRLIHEFREQGRSVLLLSGDRQSVVSVFATSVGLSAEAALGERNPEQKERLVGSTRKSMFVGDGANDALALRAAHVGFAVRGSVEASLEAAAVYSVRPGLSAVHEFLKICSRYQRVVRRALAVSIAYNGFGATAAITGVVTPLFAAVLMPVSALSVFGIVWWGLRK